jgi:PhzF family phenazine biosynthesis protein
LTTYRFKQVDVFTSRPFSGNPVAVVLGADDIDAEQMQRIAAWTNLSETTFVMRPAAPSADYRLRIFTPMSELPFAGHPTIGSAHAALESGYVPADAVSLTQECGAGLLPLTVEGQGAERRIFVRAPEAKVAADHAGAVDSISSALDAAVIASPGPMAIDVGPVWLIAQIEDSASLERLQPDMAAVSKLSGELNVIGVTAFALVAGGDEALHLRTFAPAAGVPEDPACGSCNAALGAYLAKTGLLSETGDEYVASQGRELGRDGRVFVRVHDGGRDVQIGGHSVTVIDGEISV